MLDLASDKETNCFLFAEYSYDSNKKSEYEHLFNTLFPGMDVFYRGNGCTINLASVNLQL